MGLAFLRGGWGRGIIPTPRGERGKRLEGRGSEGSIASISPAHLGSREPAEIPGWILCPLRPPPTPKVLRQWEGGKGDQKLYQWDQCP